MDRRYFYDDIVALPATQVDPGASGVTYTSDVYSDFIDSGWGQAKILVSVADTSQVTGNFTVFSDVSFDGTTFYPHPIAGYTAQLASGAGTAAIKEAITITATHAATGAGNLNITLPGDALVATALAGAETPVQIGEAVFNNALLFTTYDVAYGLTHDIVVFTKKVAGFVSGTPTVATTAADVTWTVSVVQGADADFSAAFCNDLGLAPYVRARVFGADNSVLAAGHGAKIGIVKCENNGACPRAILANAITVPTPDTGYPVGFSPVYSSALDAGEGHHFIKVGLFSYVADQSKVIDTIAYIVESSYDGVNYFAASAEQLNLVHAGATADANIVTIDEDGTYDFGRYIRIKFYAKDATGAIAVASGLSINLVGVYVK